MAEFLLTNGADLAATDNVADTPLHIAAASGHKAMAELLLARKAEPDARNNNRETPLMAAAKNGFKSVAELLLAQGAAVNAIDYHGYTALHMAVASAQRPVAELLLAKQADINARSESGDTALHIAVRTQQPGLARLLLANQADTEGADQEGKTPLLEAVEQKQVDLAEALLTHGANPNTSTPTMRLREPVLFPEQLWASLENATPLLLAVAKRDTAMVDLLVKSKADVNRRGAGGITPLILSVPSGQKEIAEDLLAHQAEVSAQDKDGFSPLHWAAKYGLRDMAELLLAHGADVNSRMSPETPGDARPTAVLRGGLPGLNSGRMVPPPGFVGGVPAGNSGSSGWSPLHTAVCYRRKGLAELLLSKGADANAASRDGSIPLDILKQPSPGTPNSIQAGEPYAGEKEIENLLREHGASEFRPRPGLITISRVGRRYSTPLFFQGTNSYNQFTLLELLSRALPMEQTVPLGIQHTLAFPDLAKVRINRLDSATGKIREIAVDLTSFIAKGDCSKNLALEWGDVVEIPEQDHPINAHWTGLAAEEQAYLVKCLERTVSLVVKGETVRHTVSLGGWLPDVVRSAKVLRASSDQSRVKVTRVDPSTQGKQEFLFNLETAPDERNLLWVRDGDVIEIPDRP